MKKSKAHQLALYRALTIGLVLLVAIVVFGTQVSLLRDSLHTIANADLGFMAWALLALGLSYMTAAVSYCLLAVTRLRFWPTTLIQVADGFTNRLLPGSIGGIATNLLYLIKQHHNKIKASFVVSADNILGFIGHSVLMFALLITSTKPVRQLFVWHFPVRQTVWVIILGLVIAIYLVFARRTLRRVKKTVWGLVGVGRIALIHPLRLFMALLTSMLTTIMYGLMLYFSMLAVNVHVSLLQAFLALTIGVAAIVVTPTPGGLGGAEAGLAATLTGMGVPAHQALSAALMYRFVTFWLPIIPGFVALQVASNKDYIGSN